MTERNSRGIVHLKSARGKPGSGVVARHSDGLVTSGGRLDDGDWFFMAVTADEPRRGAFATAATQTAAMEEVCDELGLSRVTVIGGRSTKS